MNHSQYSEQLNKSSLDIMNILVLILIIFRIFWKKLLETAIFEAGYFGGFLHFKHENMTVELNNPMK